MTSQCLLLINIKSIRVTTYKWFNVVHLTKLTAGCKRRFLAQWNRHNSRLRSKIWLLRASNAKMFLARASKASNNPHPSPLSQTQASRVRRKRRNRMTKGSRTTTDMRLSSSSAKTFEMGLRICSLTRLSVIRMPSVKSINKVTRNTLNRMKTTM